MKATIRSLFILPCLLSVLTGLAEIPAGYYASCEGKTGQALLKALCQKINPHVNKGYDGLWTIYAKSDVRDDGTLWDIYSTKRWPSNFTRCGNYSVVGDCVNREHSLPKSWWGGGKATQYSDAFHLYPTDGKVNGQRSNFAFGECANGTSLPASGSVRPLGKLGASTFSGFSGTVFEPDDEYKGDLARSYFYMAACYNDIISGWTNGNGSDMLAGNSYPVFREWAIRLLLKWARQDQVSQKEINRNDAIYSFQENRNPFIDHPELIEYIWGDKVGQAWYSSGSSEPSFVFPVQNAQIDLGIAACGVPRSARVEVKGVNLTDNVTVSATGGFTVSPASVTAAEANAGTFVTVTVNAPSAGDAEGILTVRSGNVSRSVDLYAEIVDGLPAKITGVSSDGFTLAWVNLHSSQPSVTYGIDVRLGTESVAGFPIKVLASDESAEITGLDPSTTYSVSFHDVPGIVNLPHLTATTADPIPSIQVLFDGNLHLTSVQGEPSEIAELLLETENIDTEIDVKVEAPFEVSTDKATWAASTTLAADEDRFYLRLGATEAGDYRTDITLSAGTYSTDNASATAKVSASAGDFLEDWEEVEDPTNTVKAYSSTTFRGTASTWAVNDGGFGTASQDKDFNNSVTLRMGKNATSSIAMAEDKENGLGTVSFEASKWPNDSEPTAIVDLEYSTDGGITWQTAETFRFDETSASTFSASINTTGNGRIRFAQKSGERWFIDNISITDHSEIGAVGQLDYHKWDAYCRDHLLQIENRDGERTIHVYSTDGIMLFGETVSAPLTTLSVPAGLYIVTDGSFARRVIVR
ncbi:MAG: endonuclease [Paramuribaculum sp.]|nr:endonuclease [Paramuribaculum sp.]MDE6489019.1 endonuclease [Paramuribaculum sp.]